MIRLSAPALLGVVCLSALVGFGAGWIAGPSASPVSAAEPALIQPSDPAATPGAEEPKLETEELAAVGALAVHSGREATPQRAAPHSVPPSVLDRAVRRVEAPKVELPTGTASIAGRVTTKEGEPLGGIEVVATPVRPGTRAVRPASKARVFSARKDLEEVLAKAAKDWAEGEGRSLTATTAPDGTFRIEGLADLSFRVRAQGDGYQFQTREYAVLRPADRPDAEVKIQGEPLQRIEVQVVGPDGVPVEEAILVVNRERLDWTSADPTVYVSPKQFRIQALAEPFEVGVYSSGAARLLSETVPVDVVADPERVVTLHLQAACAVVGRIVGENVTTDTWQSVYAVPLRVDEPFDATVPAPDDLEANVENDVFLFADLTPGQYAICLIGPGQMPVDHEIVSVGPGMIEITLDREVHDPSKYLAVRAISPRSTPVEDFNVSLQCQKAGSEVGGSWLRTRGLPDGTRLLDVSEFEEFDYDAWPSGARAWLVATSTVYGQVRVPLTSGQRDATVQFEEPCELVVQLEGDYGMGGFVVKVLDADTEHTEPPTITQASQRPRRGRTRIDARGQAHFRALSPGPVVVTLSKAGYWWGEGNEIARVELDLTGKDHEVSLEVPQVSDLAVRLTPCKERHYLEIVITDEDGEEHEVASLQTTEDGRGVFRGLPPGEYEIKDNKTGATAMATVPGPEVRIDLAEHVIKLSVSVNKLDGKLAEWGLAGGDMIVAIDGDKIEDRNMLLDRMHKDGVTVTVERGEETLELDLPRYPRETRDANPMGGWIYIDS